MGQCVGKPIAQLDSGGYAWGSAQPLDQSVLKLDNGVAVAVLTRTKDDSRQARDCASPDYCKVTSNASGFQVAGMSPGLLRLVDSDGSKYDWLIQTMLSRNDDLRECCQRLTSSHHQGGVKAGKEPVASVAVEHMQPWSAAGGAPATLGLALEGPNKSKHDLGHLYASWIAAVSNNTQRGKGFSQQGTSSNHQLILTALNASSAECVTILTASDLQVAFQNQGSVKYAGVRTGCDTQSYLEQLLYLQPEEVLEDLITTAVKNKTKWTGTFQVPHQLGDGNDRGPISQCQERVNKTELVTTNSSQAKPAGNHITGFGNSWLEQTLVKDESSEHNSFLSLSGPDWPTSALSPSSFAGTPSFLQKSSGVINTLCNTQNATSPSTRTRLLSLLNNQNNSSVTRSACGNTHIEEEAGKEEKQEQAIGTQQSKVIGKEHPYVVPGGLSGAGAVAGKTCSTVKSGAMADVTLDEPVASPETWHEIVVAPFEGHGDGKQYLVVTQNDVTTRSLIEQKLIHLTEAQLQMLESLFPRHILERLATVSDSGPTTPESRAALCKNGAVSAGVCRATDFRVSECVTIMFTDLVGFTSMSEQVEPKQVMTFLNDLFSKFDELCFKHQVSKVETAGDCFICCAGLFEEDEQGFHVVAGDEADGAQSISRKHAARRVLNFATDMLQVSKGLLMPNGKPVQQRVGIHSGAIAHGLIGNLLPKFSLFGDTMNTASRMESTSRPGRIQVSESTYALLDDSANHWECTGGVDVKGKGRLNTYLLLEDSMDMQLETSPADLAAAMSSSGHGGTDYSSRIMRTQNLQHQMGQHLNSIAKVLQGNVSRRASMEHNTVSTGSSQRQAHPSSSSHAPSRLGRIQHTLSGGSHMGDHGDNHAVDLLTTLNENLDHLSLLFETLNNNALAERQLSFVGSICSLGSQGASPDTTQDNNFISGSVLSASLDAISTSFSKSSAMASSKVRSLSPLSHSRRRGKP